MTKQKNAKGSSRAEKRNRFQQEEKTAVKPKRWMIFSIVGLVIVVSGAAIGMRLMLGGGGLDDAPLSSSSSASTTSPSVSYTAATNGHVPYPLIEADASGMIRMPVETFEDYAAHYYTYIHDDQPIEFFVLKSEDGEVRAAFNACDVCYSSLQGYSQDGQVMVCNNCGSRFPADQINVVRGGCNPSPLDRNVEGNYLVLNPSDIIRGARYF